MFCPENINWKVTPLPLPSLPLMLEWPLRVAPAHLPIHIPYMKRVSTRTWWVRITMCFHSLAEVKPYTHSIHISAFQHVWIETQGEGGGIANRQAPGDEWQSSDIGCGEYRAEPSSPPYGEDLMLPRTAARWRGVHQGPPPCPDAEARNSIML